MKVRSALSAAVFVIGMASVISGLVLLVRNSLLAAILCGIFSVLAVAIVAFPTIRAMEKIASQIESMSSGDPRPIELVGRTPYPRQLRGLITNFNSLLERTARTRHAEFEAISKVAESLLIVRPDGEITYTNEAGIRLLGQIVGRKLGEIVPHDIARSILHSNSNGNSGWKGDVSARRPNGGHFDGSLSSTQILENGKITSVVLIMQDITREKAEREALVQSEKMITLGELVAGTSHELNNPLAIVTGYSDLLMEDAKLTTDQFAKIQSIRKNAMRASNVVHSLLAFARKRKPERVKTEINSVVEAAMELKEYDLHTSGIQVVRNMGSGIPPVFADPHQIQQVFLNLINNAQDAVLAHFAEKTIGIRTELSGQNVIVRIKDTGSGISKANLKKVFDPFFTTKAVGKGTGLGLSISYGIIREHGGSICIDSEIGHGTEVIIALPVDYRGAAISTSRSSSESLGVGMRILAVDDEPDIASILQAGLSRLGFTVDSANNAAEAIRLVLDHKYDFVLTDVKMPGGSGFDLYRELCTIEPRYVRRTIFITGDTSNPATLQILEKDNLPYFSKPFDFQAMGRFLAERAE